MYLGRTPQSINNFQMRKHPIYSGELTMLRRRATWTAELASLRVKGRSQSDLSYYLGALSPSCAYPFPSVRLRLRIRVCPYPVDWTPWIGQHTCKPRPWRYRLLCA